MNIFILDKDVKKCAQYHCDKHVVKMILETAQLLCGSIWARESLTNYLYLCELGLELCNEYTYRYGKRHKSQDVIEWCLINKPNIKDVGFTEPAKAMPEEYKVKSVVESYRNYYRGAKSGFVSWKLRDTPMWF